MRIRRTGARGVARAPTNRAMTQRSTPRPAQYVDPPLGAGPLVMGGFALEGTMTVGPPQ
jgi:hypothetical protein